MPESTLSAVALPPDDAIAYLRQKINVPTEHWTDLRGEAHARAFAVAGATKEALLRDLRAAVERALTHGDTPAEFRKNFDQIVQRYGWEHTGKPGWRADIIYQTNVSTAYSAGQYRQMTTPEHLELFPFWRYQHNHPMRPRPQHVAWSGTTLRADDPWWSTHWPPNGWRCQCSVEPMSARDMRRVGKDGPDEAPPLELRDWRNPRTGEVIQVPKGIDPTFGHNPGREWLDGEAGTRAARGESPARRPMPPAQDAGPVVPPAHPDVQRARAQDLQRQAHAIQDWLDDPRGAIEVGELPEAAQRALDAKSGSVSLSAETLEKQRERHSDLADDDYRNLPALISAPDVVARDKKDRHVLFFGRAGTVFRLAIKTTVDRTENFLVSFHRVSIAEARRVLGSRELVAGSADRLEENGAPKGPPGNPS